MPIEYIIGIAVVAIVVLIAGYFWWKSQGQSGTNTGTPTTPNTSTTTNKIPATNTSTSWSTGDYLPPGYTAPSGPSMPAGTVAVQDTNGSIIYVPAAQAQATKDNYGKNTSDEAGDLSTALAAWGALTRDDKISMGLPDYMRDPAYSIVYDPDFSYAGHSATMDPINCSALCQNDTSCKSPFFLGKMGNYCYKKLT